MSVRLSWKAISVSLILLLSYEPARAQDRSSSPQDEKRPTSGVPDYTAVDSGSSQDIPSSGIEVKTPISIPPELEVRPLGSSYPLPTYETLLRWGPVYVRSLELMQNYSKFSNATSGAGSIFDQNSFNATVLSTEIVYDRLIDNSRLVVEYAPNVQVVNGQVSSNFVNQTVSLNWVRPLSPRWTLGLSDNFRYYSVRNLYGYYYLNADAFRSTIVTGGIVPSSFLDGGGSWLNESTQANFAYALSPTTSISVAPVFAYNHVTGQVNGPTTTDSFLYGGTVGWNKQISQNSSINASYGYQILEQNGTGTPYQYGQVGYSRKLGPSTVISLFAGLQTEGFVSGRNWNLTGSVQASRKIGRASASISYYRGMPLFSELGSQGLSQMVFGEFRYNFSQRWYVTAQGGYEDSLTTNIINLSGKFASGEVGYQVSPQISCFASYSYKTQAGSDPNLLVGSRYYYAGGIRWHARPAR